MKNIVKLLRSDIFLFVFITALIIFAIWKDAKDDCWHCGNHQPPHKVYTIGEIKECTKEYGCILWTKDLGR